MNILLATNHLVEYSGSEITIFTIAQGLEKFGHTIDIFSVFQKPEITARYDTGKFNFLNVNTLQKKKYDIAYVQHNSAAYLVRAFQQSTSIVLAHLGILPFLEQPPLCNVGAYCHLAISEEIKNHLIDQGIKKNKIVIFKNIIDEEIFFPEEFLPVIPKKALIYSNRMGQRQRNLIAQACNELNISCENLGRGFGEVLQEDLRRTLNRYHIVFTLGRGAIETMMCGRIPVVFDYLGGDGLVTPKNFFDFLKFNFSGRMHKKIYTKEELKEEILNYNSDFGLKLRELSMQEFGSKKLISFLEQILQNASKKIIPEFDIKEVIFMSNMILHIKGYQQKEKF